MPLLQPTLRLPMASMLFIELGVAPGGKGVLVALVEDVEESDAASLSWFCAMANGASDNAKAAQPRKRNEKRMMYTFSGSRPPAGTSPATPALFQTQLQPVCCPLPLLSPLSAAKSIH